MYCSTCGVAIAQGLSYCKNCGNKLVGRDETAGPPGVKPEMLVAAMVSVFILGLLAISVLLGVMKSVLGLETGQLLAFAFLSFLIMVLLEGVFLRLLYRRPQKTEPDHAGPALPGSTNRELDMTHVRELREPAASVIEHTTRAFDPVLNESKKN
jgi:hypothetical protein